MRFNVDNYEAQYYNNNLLKIVSKYDIDINTNRSMEYNLIHEINNRKSSNKNIPKNSDNYKVDTDYTHIIEDVDSVSIVDSNDRGYDRNNNDNCCMCRIM